MRTENLTKKSISDFTKSDTIYISKTESGYGVMYLCKFIEYKRGIVRGEVVEPKGKHSPGDEITASLNNCLLWGKSDDLSWFRWHWFRQDGFVK